MKNNRGSITTKETLTVSSQIGDPQSGRRLTGHTSDGQASIILLDIRDPDDIEIYERLCNDKENFKISHEHSYSGRYTVFVEIHYIRLTECKLDLSNASFMKYRDSAKRGPKRVSKKKARKKSSKKSEGRGKAIGFHRR